MSRGRPLGRIFDGSLKVWMTESMTENLRRTAKEEETSMSEIVRKSVRFYLRSKQERQFL